MSFLLYKKNISPSFCLKLILIAFLISTGALKQKCQAQAGPSINQIESDLKDLFGLDKLKALNQLSLHYEDSNTRKAIRYGRQAVNLGKNIFKSNNDQEELTHLIQAHFQLGKMLHERGNHLFAQVSLEEAKKLSEQINYQIYLVETDDYLDQIDALIESGEIKENFITKKLKDIKVGEKISNTSNDVKIQTELISGKAMEKAGEFDAAVGHYENAINFLKDKGDEKKINEIQLKVAFLLDSLDQHTEAQVFLDKALDELEINLENKTLNLELKDLAIIAEQEDLTEEEFQESIQVEKKKIKEIAENFAAQKDFEKSLAYYKLYQELAQKVVEDSLVAAAEKAQSESKVLLLQQQQRIANLNVTKQIRLRNTYLGILGLILLSALVILYFYTLKRREHKKLTIAYRDLDKTKDKLIGAEQKIVKLLSQQVSGDVAKELLRDNSNKPGERRFVCIMFLDIRDFTPTVEKLSPEEIIVYQNNVFGFMIDIIQKHNGNIHQLLGDGFMATFGAPVSHGNDCQNAFLAAQEILKEIKDRNDAGVIKRTKVGIGLHAGYVVTGNVGTEARKQYSVTGNPVIIASRVEQLNKTYKSQMIITEEVFNRLDQTSNLDESFMEVLVKGRSNPVKILKIA